MARALKNLEREAFETASRIRDLREARRRMANAREEEDHEARRYRDALERQGGRAPAVESRLSLLEEGRKLTARALGETERELEALERRLGQIEAEIAQRRER
jgi:chromosome segregation ATPase